MHHRPRAGDDPPRAHGAPCANSGRRLLAEWDDKYMQATPRAVVVVGAQAAGKSSIAKSLATRFDRGAFIEGDVLWKMIVGGAVDMGADPDPEADRQLALRYRHGALLCESFVSEGYVAVHAENMYGSAVEQHLRSLRCARSLVVLRPRPDVIERRERDRGTNAYEPWVPPGGSLLDAIIRFDEWVAETPRIGLWIDSSDLTIEETVNAILDRWEDAAIE